jgi:hypothetical protein
MPYSLQPSRSSQQKISHVQSTQNSSCLTEIQETQEQGSVLVFFCSGKFISSPLIKNKFILLELICLRTFVDRNVLIFCYFKFCFSFEV